ncbi:MAG TPA: phosphopantetheine-binding protein [Opitutaceae bacterium]
MEPTASTGETPHRTDKPEDRIRHFPAPVRDAFARFQAGGDAAALEPVVFAILEDFIPKTPAQPLAAVPLTSRLIDDLGFDSIAITEVVFFTEDLFGIRISNEEILKVQTLEDLLGFIREKVAARPGC